MLRAVGNANCEQSMRHARLWGAAGAALLLSAALPAQAIEFHDLGLARPEGVAGLMFDDQLCFPPAWLEYEGINMLGTSAAAALWLEPLALLGGVVEQAAEPGPVVVAGQMRDVLVGDQAAVDRANVEYGRGQVEGYLAFLDCMMALDPAVFQLYHEFNAGLAPDLEGTVRRFGLTTGDRQVALAGELAGGGAAAAEAMVPLLDDPRFTGEGRTSELLLLVRTFGQLGPDAAIAAPGLVSLLGGSPGTIRAAARQSLASIGPASVPPVTSALATAELPTARFDAALVLSMIEPPALDAIPALEAAITDPDENVREAAQRALDRIRPPPPPAPVVPEAVPAVPPPAPVAAP